MADFDTPFGSDAERRLASSLEKLNGFPCGPAEQPLFNGLIWQFQSELKAIHDEAGVAGDDSTSRTTVDAILALIAAAIGEFGGGGGGGDTSGFVLMTQARARLPIFPEVLNTDGRIVVTSPSAGTIRIPGGVDFQHRGIFSVTTAQTDFATAASKIYHLRWSPAGGFSLNDVADATYNPTAAAETSTLFDSTYDDMLVARVVTNSSNVATITNLANKDRLRWSGIITTSDPISGPNILKYFDYSQSLNWSRMPDYSLSHSRQDYDIPSGIVQDHDFSLEDTNMVVTREKIAGRMFVDGGHVAQKLRLLAVA